MKTKKVKVFTLMDGDKLLFQKPVEGVEEIMNFHSWELNRQTLYSFKTDRGRHVIGCHTQKKFLKVIAE